MSLLYDMEKKSEYLSKPLDEDVNKILDKEFSKYVFEASDYAIIDKLQNTKNLKIALNEETTTKLEILTETIEDTALQIAESLNTNDFAEYSKYKKLMEDKKNDIMNKYGYPAKSLVIKASKCLK